MELAYPPQKQTHPLIKTMQPLRTDFPLKVSCTQVTQGADDQEVVRVTAVMDNSVLATVHFSYNSQPGWPITADGRTALLTFLPVAMRLGVGIEVLDPLDAMTLSRLEEWQEVMAHWHPHTLHSVPIRASHVVAAHRAPQDQTCAALMGFSGGVDSCHTLWRHSATRRQSSIVVKTGLLVHGMDIPLNDPDAFKGASRRAETMLRAHGATLQTVATDIRALERQFKLSWETHTHGIVLSACLSLFERQFDTVLIASTYPAHDLRFPWGSNPVTDVMLGGVVPLLHDGSACNKLAKISEFASDAEMAANVRVCWQGDRKDANCGRCFKCITTQVGFWLADVPHPKAFDRPSRVGELKHLHIKNAVNYRLVINLRDKAIRSERHDIAEALGQALRRSRLHKRFLISQCLGAIGINLERI